MGGLDENAFSAQSLHAASAPSPLISSSLLLRSSSSGGDGALNPWTRSPKSAGALGPCAPFGLFSAICPCAQASCGGCVESAETVQTPCTALFPVAPFPRQNPFLLMSFLRLSSLPLPYARPVPSSRLGALNGLDLTVFASAEKDVAGTSSSSS